MKTSIVWFRQDLRIHDNPALFAACRAGKIIPVFIFDDTLPSQHQAGAASNWWLHRALVDLNKNLANKLIVRSGDPLTVLLNLCDEYHINSLCWNRMYEKWAIQRDKKIKDELKHLGFEVKSFNGALLWEPMSVLKKDETPYKVFTPFYRRGCLSAEPPRIPLPKPELAFADGLQVQTQSDITKLNLLPTIDWDDEITRQWEVSEQAAKDKLNDFLQTGLHAYADRRNLPAMRGTSRLSPYLHFGQLSPNQAWYAIKDKLRDTADKGADTFLSELGWREFSYYLLYHFDDIATKNFNPKFDAFPWQNNEDHIEAWQKGKTGIPIIDAGMRELWRTGYMHNRIRMVVGSFLVKNLLIDWRIGERWFWDCLLDADTASNAASWQWVAGSGADAAPYFRIFNPILQGEKFDKEGEYVKRFCPELNNMPAKYIHKPWEAPKDILRQSGVELGKNYPKPIIDLKASRQAALDAYKTLT